MATRGRLFEHWPAVKADFITLHMSFASLAKKWGLNKGWVATKARKEKWEEERKEYESKTEQKQQEEARRVYVRDKISEAAKFAGLKEKLRKVIDMIIAQNRSLKDVADIARAICMLEEREAVLCGESSQISEHKFRTDITQMVKEISDLDLDQLEERFEEEKKRLREEGHKLH